VGGVSFDRWAGLDPLPVKAIILLLVLFVSGSARAGTVQLAFTSFNKASSSVSGSAAAANAGKFITPATVTVSGRLVTVPATASFAANAASFAVSAVRLSPATLVVGLVVPWLAAEGLQWANNSWIKETPGTSSESVGFNWKSYAASPYYPTAAAACEAARVHPDLHGSWYTLAASGNYVGGVLTYWGCNVGGRGSGYSTYSFSLVRQATCYSGYTLVSGQCVGAPTQVAATESDFTTAGTHPITDAAAEQLAEAGVAMPVQNPVFDPVDVPLGEPRLDPVANRKVQDRVRVEQTDPVSNPDLASVTPYTVDAGAVPGQTEAPPVLPEYNGDETVSGSEPALDVQTDCDKYPEASGCKELGTPDDTVNLETQNPSMTVNPLSFGGGQASCPPDKVVSVSGQSISIPYGHMCSLAGWIKPILLAIAWFVAASIVAGSVRPE